MGIPGRNHLQPQTVIFSSIETEGGSRNSLSNPCLILSSVDDLIVCTPKAEDVDFVFETIGKKVRLKRTGFIASDGQGGQLKFLGRVITRRKGEKSVLVS